MKDNQTIVLYMNDGVECGEARNMSDAYKMLQECKRLDKEEHIVGNEYYFELHEETETEILISDVKIYRRKNRYFMKGI